VLKQRVNPKRLPPDHREQCRQLAAGTFDFCEMTAELASELTAYLYFTNPRPEDGGLSSGVEAAAFRALRAWKQKHYEIMEVNCNLDRQ
jgi:hypothetical protein